MNKNAAIINLPVKRKRTQPDTAIITYLNKSQGRAGKSYLYKVVYSNFTPPDTAAVCSIKLPLDNTRYRSAKRAMDIFLSVVVIVFVLTWLIPLMAILIKAGSRGPVFFLQQRHKQNGKVFTCIKFRSMMVNDEADILPATENDKRITPIGKIMRRTFMDELPQFFNVLWGDMSVIGPRPHMLSENLRFEEQVSYYRFREKAKPGITGLSQIIGLEGAADTVQKMKDRIDVDVFYLRHWTLKMDMIILYRTFYKLLGF
ncbi:sugar transferase [Ferruginibacter sp.]